MSLQTLHHIGQLCFRGIVFCERLYCERATELLTADQTQIVNTVSVIFAAARTDDVAKFDSVIAPDFYIYDGGVRFTGDTVVAMIKAQHAAGNATSGT